MVHDIWAPHHVRAYHHVAHPDTGIWYPYTEVRDNVALSVPDADSLIYFSPLWFFSGFLTYCGCLVIYTYI